MNIYKTGVYIVIGNKFGEKKFDLGHGNSSFNYFSVVFIQVKF